jgi:hypothetical protein
MGFSTRIQTRLTAHLIALAFFFLLRVGEYTPHTTKRQTVPLRKFDVKLWRQGILLSNDAPLAVLQTADAVTICLENQKNGHKNATLHHTTSGDKDLEPVMSAAIIIYALNGMHPDTAIGSFRSEGGRKMQITSAQIRNALHIAATHDNLTAQGYTMSRIGQLAAGGAMHLKLAGYDNDIIQKLGRWSSNTYLHYIQSQIGQLTAGVAKRMAAVTLQFHIVG